VGARNSATLADLRIFVDHCAEPVTSNDLDLGYVGLGECSEWGGVGKRSVWSVGGDVIFVLGEDPA
jgi:hypothetical protein